MLLLVSHKVKANLGSPVVPSRPQSSSVVPECPTLSRFLQSTASAGCPTCPYWKGDPKKMENGWFILSGSDSHDGSMVLLYMVTWIPSIYPSHVSIFLPAPWIRHGIGYYQKSIFQGGIQENHAKRTIYCGPNPRNHPSYHGLLVISFIPVGRNPGHSPVEWIGDASWLGVPHLFRLLRHLFGDNVHEEITIWLWLT